MEGSGQRGSACFLAHLCGETRSLKMNGDYTNDPGVGEMGYGFTTKSSRRDI